MNNNIFELGKFCADKADPLLDTSFDIGPLSDLATVDVYVKNLFKNHRYKYKTLRDFSYDNGPMNLNSPYYNPLGYKTHSGNYLYILSLKSNYHMLMDTDCAIKFGHMPELNYRFLQEPFLHNEIFQKRAIEQKEISVYKLRELEKMNLFKKGEINYG